MQFNILDTSRNWIAIVDNYKSAIWTPRYYEAGDFELYVEMTEDALSFFKNGYYVSRDDDTMVGIIEKINLTRDEDGGSYLIVTGRSLKSILSRRIVWQQTNLSGTVEDCIRRLVSENIISPSNQKRKIDDFILSEKKNFTETMEMQVTGDNLLDTIVSICKAYRYGFDISLNESGQFVFDLYKGVDRSYSQDSNQWVVFSPKFDNVRSIEYETDRTNFKNVALVAGEGEGLERKTVECSADAQIPQDLNRYEMYVDARDISTNNGEIVESDYNNLLRERGNENLAASKEQNSFSGEIEPAVNYEYKSDYYLGDIVQVEDEFGIGFSQRITEVIECWDENGYSIVPTFAVDKTLTPATHVELPALSTQKGRILSTKDEELLVPAYAPEIVDIETIKMEELPEAATIGEGGYVILGTGGDFARISVPNLVASGQFKGEKGDPGDTPALMINSDGHLIAIYND